MQDTGTRFINYYELLGLANDAPVDHIRTAYDAYVTQKRAELANPLTMASARYAVNTISPGIERHLLAGPSARATYDRDLAEYLRSRSLEPNDLPDDEGLDVWADKPFFFDPYADFDTEEPAYTLRDIALLLDEQWQRARTWLPDSAISSLALAGYIEFTALRPRLAERIKQVIHAASRTDGSRMDANEAIERCVTILNPDVERPLVQITNLSVDGKTLEAGQFISDLPARGVISLAHDGIRGCAYGTLESRTPWITFENGAATAHFVLMPDGTEPAVGISELQIPLLFRLENVQRDAYHTGEIVIRVENREPARLIVVPVLIHILPLPPRVTFSPAATSQSPAQAGLVRRGTPANVIITPRNAGDEDKVPLVARVASTDAAAFIEPTVIHADKPFIVTIETSGRAYGATYDVVCTVTYDTAIGARGQETLHIRGELLPTVWQSMLRQRSMEARAGAAAATATGGFIILGLLGLWLSSHTGIWWSLFALIPAMFALTTRYVAQIVVIHIQRSGDVNARLDRLDSRILYGIPAAVGAVVTLLCALIADPGAAFLAGAVPGLLVALVAGFVADGTRLTQKMPTRQR